MREAWECGQGANKCVDAVELGLPKNVIFKIDWIAKFYTSHSIMSCIFGMM